MEHDEILKLLEYYTSILTNFILGQDDFKQSDINVNTLSNNEGMTSTIIFSPLISFLISVKKDKDIKQTPVLSLFFYHQMKPSDAVKYTLTLISLDILTKFVILEVGEYAIKDNKMVMGEGLKKYVVDNVQNIIRQEKFMDDVMRFSDINIIPSC